MDKKIHFYSYDSNNNFHITDPNQTGNTHFGVGDDIELDQWYSLALVGDGSTNKIFLKSADDSTYTLIHTHAGGALANSVATWVLGRGFFNGGADGFNGYLDDVRISDEALATQDLLGNVVPEPASASLLLLGLGALLARRK
ncbi:PEP-CTERM motif protein [Poriferisphaera corsica]|uniref:PEP-CTERM motif protein n=1 Tax=Poriferisphaera corsica TaxID=2528020 RepID=A0A517YZ89_9BACT|nr:PEP-CTERM motif protein [Poriferisphaera corsica]